MKIALVLLLCISAALSADLSFQYSSNISANLNNNGWNYRKVSFRSWSAGLWNGANYVSSSVNKVGNSLSSDLLVGACYVQTGFYPFSFVSFFESNASWNLGIGSGLAFASADVSAGAGYVGSSYLTLVEKNPAGVTVNSQSLRNTVLPSRALGLFYTAKDNTDTDSTLKYVTYIGKNSLSSDSTFSVSLSYIVSSVAGVLNQANTVVGPKSFETVVHIENYPYANAANSLSLLIGVGTGQATVSADGSTIISKSGNTQVYFTAATQAVVNGNIGNVAISVSGNSTGSIDNTDFESQLNGKYGGSASYQVITVTFPAGASDIIYDPSIGSGEPMRQDSSSSRTPILFSFVFFVLIAISL